MLIHFGLLLHSYCFCLSCCTKNVVFMSRFWSEEKWDIIVEKVRFKAKQRDRERLWCRQNVVAMQEHLDRCGLEWLCVMFLIWQWLSTVLLNKVDKFCSLKCMMWSWDQLFRCLFVGMLLKQHQIYQVRCNYNETCLL